MLNPTRALREMWTMAKIFWMRKSLQDISCLSPMLLEPLVMTTQRWQLQPRRRLLQKRLKQKRLCAFSELRRL
jgi:hypothetical protein